MKCLSLLILLLFLSCSKNYDINYDKEINSLMDNWHKAAATADEDVFFGSMTEDAIYLGTDKTERWLRDELKEWSKTFFERDKAWEFKPFDRVIYYSQDKQTAWFEESLNTWMGVCRGSGVIERSNKQWKIKHYHLAMTIDNDLANKVISLHKDKQNQNE